MRETPDDLAALQRLLDRSYAKAGPHLLAIHDPKRRLDAAGIVERATGMCLLTLATVTADGRPITGPVDGIFYRGSFHFGSAPRSGRLPPHPGRPPGERHAPARRGARRDRARPRFPYRHRRGGERGLPPDGARHLSAALRARVG